MLKIHLGVCGVAAVVACTVAFAQQAPVRLSIQAQPLDKALNSWADQTGYQVLIPVERASRGRTAPSVEGTFTPEGALKILLASTDLKYQFVNPRTVAIRAPKEDAAPTAPNTTQTAPNDSKPTEHERPLVLAQSRPRETQAVAAAGTADRTALSQGTSRDTTEEVIVTAQKRSERLQDVPVPVTAIAVESLVERSQVRLQDFYTRVPGLNLTTGSGSQDAPILSVRGVTTGGTGFGANPTVAVVVDDVPYGSSTSFGGGNLVPDLDPGDLARIEVLRGPQGTLYGASSLGGLLKYVTVDPSTEKFSGRLQGGLGDVYNGAEKGYSFRGSVNVPLSETFAVRASGFTRRDPGYIDDPGLGAEGVNERTSHGGRVSALWRPSESLSLKLSALKQHSDTNGSHLVHVLPGLQDLQQRYVLPGLGGYTRDSDVYSATLAAKFGSVELTSISGYAINDVSDTLDRTSSFGARTQAAYGVTGAQFVENFKTDKFNQEIRLAGSLGSRTDWVVGTFFTRESSHLVQDIDAVNPASLAVVGLPYHNPFHSTFKEYAAFTDVTYQFTDRFDVQVGGRVSRNEQDLSAEFDGIFMPVFFGFPSGYVYPTLRTDDTAFTYLLTPRFKVTPQLMVYARFASGYRPGGPQPNATAVGSPPFFKADTTRNYEIGVKADMLDHAWVIDASLFYIDWNDIQLQLRDPVTTFAYFGNGGGAKSQGLELSTEVRPWTGMTIASSVAWNDAELTQAFPPGPSRGLSGDRLPFSSRFSGNLSLDQSFSFVGRATAFVGASVSYVGNRLGGFTSNGVRQNFPSYAQTDVRAGVRIDSWGVDLFANNLTDRRGLLAGGLGTAQPFAFAYIQPRTYGMSVSKTF